MVFTSGSTGTPKGAMMTHRGFSSGIKHQQSVLRYSPQSRVFDYVSYSFDVIWPTLCRLWLQEDAFVSHPRQIANIEYLPPYRHLRPTLHTQPRPSHHSSTPPRYRYRKPLLLGGEALSAADIKQWEDSVHLIQVYGPAECVPLITATIARPSSATFVARGTRSRVQYLDR